MKRNKNKKSKMDNKKNMDKGPNLLPSIKIKLKSLKGSYSVFIISFFPPSVLLGFHMLFIDLLE